VNGLECCTAIIGYRYMRRNWPLWPKLLVILTWVTVAVEMTGLTLLLLHISHGMYNILGIYSAEIASQAYVFFSLAANIFMYGGFIACFRTLRRQDSMVLEA
jgi:hypothetical protein